MTNTNYNAPEGIDLNEIRRLELQLASKVLEKGKIIYNSESKDEKSVTKRIEIEYPNGSQGALNVTEMRSNKSEDSQTLFEYQCQRNSHSVTISTVFANKDKFPELYGKRGLDIIVNGKIIEDIVNPSDLNPDFHSRLLNIYQKDLKFILSK